MSRRRIGACALLIIACLCALSWPVAAQQQDAEQGGGAMAAAAAAASAPSPAEAQAQGFELAPPLLAASGGLLPRGASFDLGDPEAAAAAAAANRVQAAAIDDDELLGSGALGGGALGSGDAADSAAAAAAEAAAAAAAGPSLPAAEPSPPGELFSAGGGIASGRRAGDVIPGRFILAIGVNASTADAIDG